jgi:hypothetical protein
MILMLLEYFVYFEILMLRQNTMCFGDERLGTRQYQPSNFGNTPFKALA